MPGCYHFSLFRLDKMSAKALAPVMPISVHLVKSMMIWLHFTVRVCMVVRMGTTEGRLRPVSRFRRTCARFCIIFSHKLWLDAFHRKSCRLVGRRKRASEPRWQRGQELRIFCFNAKWIIDLRLEWFGRRNFDQSSITISV